MRFILCSIACVVWLVQCCSLGHARPPLYLDIYKGKHKNVEKRLQSGKDPNLTPDNPSPNVYSPLRYTYLQYAVKQNQKECVECLLKYGADVNEQIRDEGYAGKKTKIRTFVRLEYDPYFGSYRYGNIVLYQTIYWETGATPLFCATRQNNMLLTRILLESGADPSIPNKEGETPVFNALKNKNTECLNLLLEKNAVVDNINQAGDTALLLATSDNNIDAITLLLKKGVNVNITNRGGNTALIIAARHNNMDAFNLLVKYGKNDVNYEGDTPLTLALKRKDAKMIELLLKNGANVNISDKDLQTPLMIAVKNNDLSTVTALLAKGSEVNKQDNIRNTALHYTAYLGESDGKKMANILLEHGALESYDVENSKGRTPIGLAQMEGNTKVYRLLKDRKKRKSTPGIPGNAIFIAN